jgi:hypothetical protein
MGIGRTHWVIQELKRRGKADGGGWVKNLDSTLLCLFGLICQLFGYSHNTVALPPKRVVLLYQVRSSQLKRARFYFTPRFYFNTPDSRCCVNTLQC